MVLPHFFMSMAVCNQLNGVISFPPLSSIIAGRTSGRIGWKTKQIAANFRRVAEKYPIRFCIAPVCFRPADCAFRVTAYGS
jgi:hypothetical protein